MHPSVEVRLVRQVSWKLLVLMMAVFGPFVLLPLAPSAYAQGLFEQALAEAEPEASTDVSPASSGSSFELGGYLRGALWGGKTPEEAAGELKSGYGEAALNLRARTGELGDAFAELRFRSGLDSAGQSADASSLDLREAYVNLWLGPLDLRLGQQIIAWGRADALNPTDNVTPKDMSFRSANEDDRRIANLALRATLNMEPVKLETVWVPLYRMTRLPSFSLGGPLVIGPSQEPNADLMNGTAAARLHLELAAFEASLSYLIGYSTMPGVTYQGASVDEAGALSATLAMTAYQHQVAGFDLSTTLGDWAGLPAEGAWRQALDGEGAENRWKPRPDILAVLGLDREFGDLWVILQYAGRFVLDHDEPAHGAMDMDAVSGISPEMLATVLPTMEGVISDEIAWRNRIIAGQTEEMSHQVLARLNWSLLYETLSLSLLGSYNVSTTEWLARPSLVYQIEDALALSLGAEIYAVGLFSDDEDTLYGMIDQTMSAGFVELKASF